MSHANLETAVHVFVKKFLLHAMQTFLINHLAFISPGSNSTCNILHKPRHGGVYQWYTTCCRGGLWRYSPYQGPQAQRVYLHQDFKEKLSVLSWSLGSTLGLLSALPSLCSSTDFSHKTNGSYILLGRDIITNAAADHIISLQCNKVPYMYE